MKQMEYKFESNTQELKYKVLKAAAKAGFNKEKRVSKSKLAKEIIPGPKPSFRCCIHKERTIIKERLQIALHEEKDESIIKVIDSACEQCPIQRYTVTDACRGCIARSCENSCPVDAVYMVAGRAYINYEKCIECGKCKETCQFNAISDTLRPCRRSCPVDAIEIDDSKIAKINYEKCISCGQCAYNCPFGAITDISYVKDVAQDLANKVPMYALIAPSIASQFNNTKIGQVTHSLKKIGFKDVIEVALGADIVIKTETEEFIQRMEENNNYMTTSCCPSFVNLIEANAKDQVNHISTTVSPMVALGRLVKDLHKDAVTVFIGPCIAKKHEAKKPEFKDAIDYVITFEELRSLLGAKDIVVCDMPEDPLNNASYQGRMFAVQGGVASSITNYIIDNNLDVDFQPVLSNGAKECLKNINLAKYGKLKGNFIEGMACNGGCISGPGSLTHQKKDANTIKQYALKAKEKTTNDALEVINTLNLKLHKK
ncbi:hypothetical protein CI105_02400 [Candidatus Izimaplasma bacterium ZiA1]|nr:hypothetical protein CI105_02400 [Candidatus Izimaplasma bacterium ZiA1]